jgi:hypothetical protein
MASIAPILSAYSFPIAYEGRVGAMLAIALENQPMWVSGK